MTQSRGPNRAKYQAEYNRRPEELKRRRELGKARYDLEKSGVKIPEGMDLHHKKAFRSGGTADARNLVPEKPSEHRAWNKGKKQK